MMRMLSLRHARSRQLGRWLWPLGVAAGAALLAGCSQPPEPTLPPPVPQVVVSPSLEATVVAWVFAYREAVGVPEFDLVPMSDEVAFDAVAEGGAVVAITGLEPPPGWFATPLARESLAVVLHPSNPVRGLSLEALTDLYTGRAADWSAVGGEALAVQLVVLPQGDALRERFDGVVLRDARVWPGALVAPSPQAVIELVRSDRGAIGYLPLSQLVGSLRVVRVEGVEPSLAASGGDTYPLWFTVVATAPEEPVGAVRDWLAWLQANPQSP